MERLAISALDAAEPEVGRWLGALEEVRRKTVETVTGCDEACLDWCGPDGRENPIGALLYHVGLVEMSWLYLDLLRTELPSHVKELFPYPSRDEANRLTRVPSTSLDEHLQALAQSRRILLDVLRDIDVDGWRRLRTPVDGMDYETNPEWVVFHLIEHEAGHTAQMSSLKARWLRHQDGT
ncbi:DinB superfamily protein [Maioricimonas rarisocia]|uniref:DinB superfamily protein n=1 Tax=Maioricimonas rarisocia TaxID=2528026 RepID=A0A517Z3S6_9PLAN|nr:DinB family protein [Maioricimonas rarisocia]QDU37085.1 DinB superfamily protein [Maioricimonas rarisocia]